MTELEALAPIRGNHYAQGLVSHERRMQRIERRRRGEAQMPKRRWKRGQGTHARSLLPSKLWSPFNENGNLTDEVRREFYPMGALIMPEPQ